MIWVPVGMFHNCFYHKREVFYISVSSTQESWIWNLEDF